MDFPKILRTLFFPILAKIGYRISSTTELRELREFIFTLHPVRSDLVRVGDESDGGYLVPNDLAGIKYCFSPGVSTNSGFESALSNLGIISYMADYSVDKPPTEDANFRFVKKYVAPLNTDIEMNFQTWVEESSSASDDLILQMDIEGSEYACILSCDRIILRRFRILLIEFHGLDMLFDSQAFPVLRDCFRKILQDFDVVHIHPNNNDPIRRNAEIEIPSLMEFTFHRKDRVTSIDYSKSFPHPLDRRNVDRMKDVFLPKVWFRG